MERVVGEGRRHFFPLPNIQRFTTEIASTLSFLTSTLPFLTGKFAPIIEYITSLSSISPHQLNHILKMNLDSLSSDSSSSSNAFVFKIQSYSGRSARNGWKYWIKTNLSRDSWIFQRRASNGTSWSWIFWMGRVDLPWRRFDSSKSWCGKELQPSYWDSGKIKGQPHQSLNHAPSKQSWTAQQAGQLSTYHLQSSRGSPRFDSIEAEVRPFLSSSGYDLNKVSFVPCGATVGENLLKRDSNAGLSDWYQGPTLVEVLGE